MIRTHRPTGHHWTCASHFQQSKQYRNLDAESCEAPSAKVISSTDESRSNRASRSAKRRKVETLANNFLEGKPLFISTACSNGLDLASTVENVLREKNLSWSEVLDGHDGDLWADGEDGWDALRKRGKRRPTARSSRSPAKALQENTMPQCDESISDVVVAPPEPRQQQLLPTICTAPSDEALARAAELRARKGSISIEINTRLELPMPLAGQGTQSAPPTVRAPSSSKDPCSSRPYNPHTPAETTMADELRLSRTESPSRRPRAFTLPAASFDSQATVEDIHDHNHLQSLAYNLQAQSTAGPSTGVSAVDILISEQSEEASNPASSEKDATRNDEAAPSGQRFTATTDYIEPDAARQSQSHNSTNTQSRSKRNASTKEASTRTSKRLSSRRQIKSSQQTSEASEKSSQSKLTESFQASKSEYAAAEKSQGGSTSFVYRKKAKASRTSPMDQPEPESVQGPQKTSPLPAEIENTTPKTSNPATLASAAPPTLDTSFKHGSSFAPNINIAQVDGDTERVLPRSPGSHLPQSSLKKSSMLSGAQAMHAPSITCSSSHRGPFESSAFTRYPESGEVQKSANEGTSARCSTGQWPGTQVLLSRAQEDFFVSPEKLALGPAAGNDTTTVEAHTDFADTPDRQSSRQPLQQMSQECLPATQALIDNWSPWSTAKKVKSSLKRKSNVPSPLAARNGTATLDSEGVSNKSSVKRPRLSEHAQEKSLRRSSLRFSTMTAETPLAPQTTSSKINDALGFTCTSTNVDTHSPTFDRATPQGASSWHGDTTHDDINLDLTAFSFAASNAFDTAHADDSMAEWNSNGKISGFQNAQQMSTDPNADTTLADLATEYLSTADIDGVLGKG